jgi:hypothetical protein
MFTRGKLAHLLVLTGTNLYLLTVDNQIGLSVREIGRKLGLKAVGYLFSGSHRRHSLKDMSMSRIRALPETARRASDSESVESNKV